MRLLFFIAFSLCSFVPQAVAQDQNPEWVELSPPGESFQLLMPNQPRMETENVGVVSGKRYTALTGIASYTIWSITNANYRADQDTDTDAYLDATAELVWEGLLEPAREALDEKDRRFARMSYVRDLPPEGLPGREYTLTIGDLSGTTEFFVVKEHLYVLLVTGKPGADLPREKFFASFRVSSRSATSVPTNPQEGGGFGPRIAPRESEGEDYNRIFSSKEVTSKARVLEKKEPTYTESARKFSVTGTVVIRCVFSKDGEVTNIHVVRKLPHGLTQKAIAAARAIRFTPASKDGQPVSIWMQLEYNFNLY